MQLIITHSSLARGRAVQLSRWQLVLAALLLTVVLMLLSGAIYHFIFLKAAREGWPVVSQLVRLVVRDEIAQRDRFMRENLDAMAQKVGEMQAKLVNLEAMRDRVSALAGLRSEDLPPALPGPATINPGRRPAGGTGAGAGTGAAAPATAPGTGSGTAQGGRGGPFVPLLSPSLEQLQQSVATLDAAADRNTDLFMLFESRLMESKLRALMVPSAPPVEGPVGSGFGFRTDPFTGASSLHTGLDFPAEVGTPIHAAAGGMVVVRESHPAYGNLIEISHGNGLITRYAHCDAFEVEQGALVKRGQRIARVGSTGRSTGPHLHFEVLLEGTPQDPARFLGNAAPAAKEFARRPGS